MMKRKILLIIPFILIAVSSSAQILEKLGKRAGKAAERTIERRVEKETSKKTDEALDKVFENDKPSGKKKQERQVNLSGAKDQQNHSKSSGTKDPEMSFSGKTIFQDDFNSTPLGDFPKKFISNSGGEVVSQGKDKGLKFYPNSNVLLDLNNLPQNFALEFALTLENVPSSLYRTAFNIYLQELNKLKHNDPKNKFGAVGFSLWGDKYDHQIDLLNHKASFEIKEKIPYNINANVIDQTSNWLLLKQGNRLRLFINGEKILDAPNLLQGITANHINFRLDGTKKEEGHAFILSNVKVTGIAPDLRSQLIEEGKFSTQNILFTSGSDNIQASSHQLLNDIADVLKSDNSSFRIIGHTDSDGDETDNLRLSQKRAESVKKYLVAKGVSASRLHTDGKGESNPVASNDTEGGKAQNRRVEFIKN